MLNGNAEASGKFGMSDVRGMLGNAEASSKSKADFNLGAAMGAANNFINSAEVSSKSKADFDWRGAAG